MINNTANSPSSRTILLATGISLAVALLLLLTVILPAEFGRDPLGTGELTGLTALSRTANPLEEQFEVHRQDYREFELGPFQSVEYKYLMDRDTPLVFSWLADGELYFDMHAEPAGLGEDYAESFEQGNEMRRTGSYYAPFTGIHGWFWENRGSDTLTLRLYTAGFYQTATVFRDGGAYERAINPLAE
ncbi:MAG: hypothetical protein ACR2PR_00730 [Pseudohongiellaceae bacterium]